MEFRVLGSVEPVVNGRPVAPGAAKQRGLLALLLLDANRVAGRDWLIDQLWARDPPAAAKATLRAYVYQLRKHLSGPNTGGGVALRSRAHGYLLQVPAEAVDANRFQELTARGRQALDGGRGAEAVAAFREGLRLWRGPAFDDIDVPAVREQARYLDDVRLAVTEECLVAELELGQYNTVAAELEALTAAYPLREGLWQLLMLSLCRAGRPGEALESYQRLYRLLDDQLGIQPSAPVQQLQQQILTGDPQLQPPSTDRGSSRRASRRQSQVEGVPRQLPAAICDFTGRTSHLTRLNGLLPNHARGDQPGAVVITAIAGTAGIGKTALAVHWAHQVADRFPDGQLYLNLRGFGPASQPMDPGQAVRGLLDGLGVPAQRVPSELDAQTALYRSLLADKRVLVLLDNAHDANQIRMLLPASTGSLVIVTSRSQLAGLTATEGAYPITLDLLIQEEAHQFLAHRLGTDRVAAEPQATQAIIDSCARLPLALAIAAARAATHPDVPLQTLADELSHSTSSLDAFTDAADPVTDVRAVFSWSYRQLTPAAARLFRLLGLHPGPDISAVAAASLAALPPARTHPLLAELTRANLLSQHQTGRYTFHDLLRAYARELARTDPSAEQRIATRRMLDHYLHTAHNADRLLNPAREPIHPPPPAPGAVVEGFASPDRAVDWFTTERPVLLAGIATATNSGFDTHTWQLAWAMVDYLDRYGHWRDWIDAQRIALSAAERSGDVSAQARAHDSLVRPYVRLGRLPDAHRHAGRALVAYDCSGDPVGQARAQHKLGWVLGTMERAKEGLDHMERALELYRQVGHRAGEADALSGLGWMHTELGHYPEALAYCRQSIQLCQEVGHRYGCASSLDFLAHALHLIGKPDEAAACYQRSLAVYVDLGDRHNQAQTLLRLGDTEHSAGEVAAAEDHLRLALAMFEELGSRDADAVRVKLASLRGK